MSADSTPWLENGRVIPYSVSLVRFLGNANAALFTAQLAFWSGKGHHELGVYKTVAEWEDETTLTYRMQDAARRILRDRGYLTETHHTLQGRVYYRLHEERLNSEFIAWVKKRKTATEKPAVPAHVRRTRKTPIAESKPLKTKGLPNATSELAKCDELQEMTSRDDKKSSSKEERADLRSSPTSNLKSVSKFKGRKSFDTIDSALQGLKENQESRAARRVAGGDLARVVNPKSFPKMKVVNDTWRDVMKEHHPKIPALRLGITDYAKFRACTKQVLETASLYELLSFAAESWDTIVTHDLAWVVRKGGRLPQAPSMQEVCRFWKTFSKAFAERSAHAALGEARREATQTNERKLERDNESLRAELAKRDAEARKLKDQLRMEKQISTGLSRKLKEAPEKKGQTLTARRAALPDDIGDDEINFIPDWQKGARK